MHPGPMNRGVEIAAEVADSPRSTIVEQVANGVSVRMAVLYLLLGGQEPAQPAPATGASAMTGWLIKGARPLGGDPADILLSATARSRPSRPDPGAQVIDADGLIALPGLVDLHTHLREPGREDAETVETGTRAAALGGYTAVHAMANTDPVADTAGVVEQVWRLGRQAGHCDVQPVGAVTVGLRGTRLAELGAMADSAARVRVFSDDGSCVSDARLMRRALEYVKAFDGVIAQHAQEPRLTEGAQMNEGEVSGRLGLTGWPAAAEESVIARDCLLAAHVGSALHVCHVSTAGSVEIIRWAKSKGWRVTAEVTPHHLLLTDDLAEGYDPVYKVNPPLRTQADVAALRQGLADGTIDCVATDHAPHPLEDKETEWETAAFGMTGLETALRVVQHAMVDTGLLGWAEVADRMSLRPARIGRLAGHGNPLEPGAPANLIAVRPRPRPRPWTRPATPPRAATARSPAWCCRAGSSPRSCAASPPCSTGSWPDGRRRARGAPPGGRPRLPRAGVRRRRRDVRRDGLQHRHDRLPGDADRPVLLPPDRRDDRAAHRQHRHQRRRPRIAADLGQRLRGPRACPGSPRAGGPGAAWTTSWPRQGITGIAISGTRALTRHLRERGAMRAAISTLDTGPAELLDRVLASPDMTGADLAREVSTPEPYTVSPPDGTQPALPGGRGGPRHQGRHPARGWPHAAARSACCPPTPPPAEILAAAPDGVFFSNGPGDPAAAGYAVEAMREVLAAGIPVFGICLGSQILGRALGLGTYKLRFGHRGVNQPVQDLRTGRVHITSHNHGFAVRPPAAAAATAGATPPAGPFDTPCGHAVVSHRNLNDGVVEGLRLLDAPAFAVQYHPEAAPGPHDADDLFDEFCALMEGAKMTPGRRGGSMPRRTT